MMQGGEVPIAQWTTTANTVRRLLGTSGYRAVSCAMNMDFDDYVAERSAPVIIGNDHQDTIDDDKLFAPYFKDARRGRRGGRSCALSSLPTSEDELAIYRECTGKRENRPKQSGLTRRG